MVEASPVLVLGGTGHLGQHIVQSLLARDVSVRVLTRNPDAALPRFAGVRVPELVRGDLQKPSEVEAALDGARTMVVAVSAMQPATIRKLFVIERDAVIAAFDAAQAAGVGRVVYLSAYDFDRALIEKFNLELGRVKMAVEAALARTELNWTVVGVPFSSEIFFATLRGNKMMFPGGGPPGMPVACPADTGTIVAQAALRDDLAGQRLRAPGPQAFSFPQAAEVISQVTGREIRFRAIPLFPIAVAAWLSRPFYPYLYFLYKGMRLLNAFPTDLVERVPEDHARLKKLFDFTATTLEVEARERLA